MLPLWTRDYIGIPFVEKMSSHDGCDCYGLVKLIFKEQYKTNLPDYTSRYDSVKNGCMINDLIKKELAMWEETQDAKEGNIVLFRIRGFVWHIGLVIDSDMMIHTEKDIDSCIEKINTLRWRNTIEGYYAYNG